MRRKTQMDENNFTNSQENRNDDMYGGASYEGDSYGRDSFQQPSVQEQLNYQYQQPNTELEEPMSMGEWMVTLLIMMIPCANIVMMFVWAFSSKEKKSKSNYFKASLIFTAIQFVLIIILMIAYGAFLASVMSSTGGLYY